MLAEVLPGLLPSGWPFRHPALARLGVRRIELADVVDLVAGLDREPGWWRGLYAALENADSEALTGLPVPLADGRTVRGPRGLLIATGDQGSAADPGTLAVLGLRFVHPDAVHPLLRRLGATDAHPRELLSAAQTRGAVAASFDEADPAIAHAVLSLIRAAGLAPGEEPWLADLALPGDDGEFYPAGELLLPDSPLRQVMAADTPFGVVDQEFVDRYGDEALEAAGVLRTFATLRAEDVTLPATDEEAASLDLMAEWHRAAADTPVLVPELHAVRDLELVDPERWPGALDLLARPPLRDAVTGPVRLMLPDGRGAAAPSYTAWWLRSHPVLDGRPPGDFRLPGADASLRGLYDLAPGDLDPEFARAIGVRSSLADLLAEPGGPDELLARLADPGREVGRAQLRTLWIALAAVDPERVTPPELVRAVGEGKPEVAAADDVVVLDDPGRLPLLAGQPLILAPYRIAHQLADLLGLALASEEVPGAVVAPGTARPVPEIVRIALPDAPESYVAHDPLVVDGVPLRWWYAGGTLHASGPDGLAHGLAWASGQWGDRLLAEVLLRDPDAAPRLLAENDLEG